MLSDLYYMQENTLTEESVEFTGTLIKPPVAQQFSFMGNTTNFLHIHKKKKEKHHHVGQSHESKLWSIFSKNKANT